MTKRKTIPHKMDDGYFDLNIPYTTAIEKGKHPVTKRKTRIKLVTKLIELGYTGIAYNHSIKATAVSDSDSCSISLAPLSSILTLSPNLFASVKFHRDLLRVPLDTPFRQYTRLTVSVDSLIQAASLNSGNPVLKSYDLVAVKPLNQHVFDHVCKVAVVDLIAIDFSEKLPFRLNLPIVKAAMKRGIYFEITYSHLVADVQTRRQMILNAKLLVEWTRGKNLIFSSAAASVSELRGPCDVANLSSLLGLSAGRAKAAISKNCRSLLCSALRKKRYYKETIQVERILSTKPVDSNKTWFCDGDSWDNISSGDGDLLFDDSAKFSSIPSKVPKTSKAIDFTSIAEEMASKGFRLIKGSHLSVVPKTSEENVFS